MLLYLHFSHIAVSSEYGVSRDEISAARPHFTAEPAPSSVFHRGIASPQCHTGDYQETSVTCRLDTGPRDTQAGALHHWSIPCNSITRILLARARNDSLQHLNAPTLQAIISALDHRNLWIICLYLEATEAIHGRHMVAMHTSTPVDFKTNIVKRTSKITMSSTLKTLTRTMLTTVDPC